MHFEGNYFSYILIGDIALAIPALLFTSVAMRLRESINDGTFEAILVSPPKTYFIYLLWGLASLPRELVRIFLLLLTATFLFDFNIREYQWFNLFILEILFFPIFLALGLLGATMLIFWGRGVSVINQAALMLTVLAGAFFPVTVLPEIAQKISFYFSPFSLFLVTARKVLQSDWSVFTTALPWIGIWFITSLPLSVLLFNLAIDHNKKRGSPLLVT
ncbi:MAG: hypothetical protein IPM57_09625 [Oligoflexia bacterium]|nr:hypothetical protein [Oligoflexia bacterium]